MASQSLNVTRNTAKLMFDAGANTVFIREFRFDVLGNTNNRDTDINGGQYSPSGGVTFATEKQIADSIATVSNLAAILGRLPVSLGKKLAAASFPVTLATDEIVPISENDLNVIGTAQSALNVDALTGVAGGVGYDTRPTTAGARHFRSFTAQITGSVGISAGQVIIEGSLTGAANTYVPIPLYLEGTVTDTTIIAAQSIAANATLSVSGACDFRFIRCKISTAFVGGNITATVLFKTIAFDPRVRAVTQTTAGNLNVTAAQATAASLNATVAQGAASTTALWAVRLRGLTTGGNILAGYTSTATTNAVSLVTGARSVFGLTLTHVGTAGTFVYLKIYNKGSAPVIGTDVPITTIPIPANSTVPINDSIGWAFALGFAIAITGGAATNDANAIAANQAFLTYSYT